MKEEDKWLGTLRDKLADYSEPAPEGLWQELEQELDGVTPMARPWWYRWRSVAAAAVVLLVAGSALLWWAEDSPLVEEVASLPPALPVPPAADEGIPVVRELPLPKRGPVAELLARAEPSEPSDPSESSEPSEFSELSEPSENSENSQQSALPTPAGSFQPRRQSSPRWSLALSAAGAPVGYSAGYGGYGSLDTRSSGAQGAYEQILFNNLPNREVASKMKHHIPVTMALSLRWAIDPKWAVETGLTYTLLSSELKSGGSTFYYCDEQRLHYVGIPLKVSREVWADRRWKVYAVAGGAVEKCVDGSLTTTYTTGDDSRQQKREDVEVDALQWSLSAAAGVQLNLNRRWGLYVEPGVAYYFDDGSRVETIRKEHPLNFQVQVGFRFTFEK